MPVWLIYALAAWGPVNEIIANIPQLNSNSVVHGIVNVLGAVIGAFKSSPLPAQK